MLYTLISANTNKGQQIKLLVNLIKTSGEREDRTTEIACELHTRCDIFSSIGPS